MANKDYIVRQQVIRRAMLAALYEKRQIGQGGYVRDLTHALGHAPEECTFALDYLVEAGLVRRESIHCRITAQGVAQYEQAEVHQ